MKPIRAWHFVGDTLRDGRPIPADGELLVHTGRVVPCESGLHASLEPFDALQYSQGDTMCLVECGGEIVHERDKLVCSERRIVVCMNAEPMFRYFARQQALSVLHNYHEDPSDALLDWLMGDETARSMAYSAAQSAAWSNVRTAAQSAARSAAWSAWSALSAQSSATSAAAAVVAAARSAAQSAAWSAWSAQSAQSAATRSAAWSNARSAAWSTARAEFNALVYEAFEDWL
jgi:hypothetical protein